MAKEKPMRTCVGCRNSFPKDELIRIASYNGVVNLDILGKSDGRGVYICKDEKCLKKALKKNAFNRAFGESLTEEQIETISEEIQKHEKSE